MHAYDLRGFGEAAVASSATADAIAQARHDLEIAGRFIAAALEDPASTGRSAGSRTRSDLERVVRDARRLR